MTRFVPLLLRIAARNLVRHPWRSMATVMGVAVGIAAMLATLSVGSNVRANLQADFAATTGRASLLIVPGAGGRSVMELAPLLETLRDTPGVAALHPVLNVRIEPERDLAGYQAPVLPGIDSGFLLAGRPLEDPSLLPASLAGGRWPTPGAPEIVVATSFAEARDLALGETLAFASSFGSIPFDIVGWMEPNAGFASTNNGRVALTSLAALQDAMRLTGRVSLLEVERTTSVSIDELETALRSRLDASVDVTLPAGTGEVAGGIVDTLQAGLMVLAATMLALGAFLAYNTFMAGVVERSHAYALLRTIALRRRDVARIAIAEALIVAAMGVVLGVLLGFVLAWALAWVNAYALGLPMRTVVVPVGAIAIASLMGIVAALVAVAIPARVASQASPLAAQRASDLVSAPSASRLGIALLAASLVSTQVPWSGLFAIAASSLTMAAFAVGTALLSRALLRVALRVTSPVLDRVFGMSGKLARAFTERNANRNGVAIGTVVVGTGLVIGVGSMVAGVNERISTWIDGTIVGDVFVSAPVAFPVTFEEDARALAAIDDVSGVGIRAVRYLPGGEARARSIALVLANPERFHPDLGFGAFQYVDGQGDPATGYEVLRDPDRVLISSTLQERFDLEVGDTLSLRTSDGFAEFGIGGVVIDFTGGGETVLTTIHDLERFGGGMPDMYVVTAADGSDALEAAAALRAAFPELYLDATTASAYRDEIRAFSERTFATTNLLLILAVVVSALGVTNTLGMNLTNRQRDLATLRVLGLARRDLRKIVLAEGLVVVVVGSVLGLVLGLLLADSMTTGAAALTGYRVDAVVPWPIVGLAIVVSPLLGLLASFAPARSASNLPPVAALRKAS